MVLLLVAVASGTAVMLRPEPRRADLNVWTFSTSHARNFVGTDPAGRDTSLVGQFEQRTGRSVNVSVLAHRGMEIRLMSMFGAGDSAGQRPDLVEIEIGSVGRFFRPGVDRIGFLPLNDLLAESGWDQRLLPSRLAVWSKQGQVLGIPHDVHPVSITYRKDLFDEAGIDLASARTWEEFQTLCLLFQAYWKARGHPHRRAIELPATASDYLMVMLQQQGINLIDAEGRAHLTDPRVARTVAFYAQLVAGDRAIAADATPGGDNWTRDLAQGDFAAVFTPDWRIARIRQFAPGLAGKLAMMPLPRFDPSDAPSASWGGTMMAITRDTSDPQAAWELLRALYLSSEALEHRVRITDIIPPVIDHWNDPMYDEPDDFFGGQAIRRLYTQLAAQMHPRLVTEHTFLAQMQLTWVQNRAVSAVRAGQINDLEARCREWLMEAADRLERHRRFAERGSGDAR